MPPASVRRVGRAGVAWRLLASVLLIVLLVNGSARMTDKVWPFGPMSQYAFFPKPTDTVAITRVEGREVDGQLIDLPLNWTSGIRRADVEGRIPEIVQRPELLAGIAENWDRHHARQSPLAEVWLIQEQHQLSDLRWHPTGTVQLAHWKLR